MNFKGKTDLIRKIIMLKKPNRSIQVLLNDFLFLLSRNIGQQCYTIKYSPINSVYTVCFTNISLMC